MKTIKRERLELGAPQSDEWGAYELSIDRYEYEILAEPMGRVATVWKHRRLAGGAAAPSVAWPAGGVFIPRGHADPRQPLRSPRDSYEPSPVAQHILRDVQRFDPKDPALLLRFVNTWGLLGVGIPGLPHFSFDGVEATRIWIAGAQSWLRSIKMLQDGEKTVTTWPDLAMIINGGLGRVHPATRVTASGLDPVYRASCLLDVIWLQLWDMATGGKKLRRCRDCPAVFIPTRANQTYCSRLCANRPSVRRAKKKQKQRQLERAERNKEKGRRGDYSVRSSRTEPGHRRLRLAPKVTDRSAGGNVTNI
jgi:hypothetical protein